MNIIYHAALIAILVAQFPTMETMSTDPEKSKNGALHFRKAVAGSFTFNTGRLKGSLRQAGFVSADRELGDWLAFPRDPQAVEVIKDGRWDLGSSPLEWSMMPPYDLPLALRHDPGSGITVVVLAQQNDCFGIFTPYGEEKHISNYLSHFGHDIESGEIAHAHSRLVVLSNPTVDEIHDVYDFFAKTTH